MQFTIHRAAFLRALRLVSGVVERKISTLFPILSNVLLQVEGRSLTLVASDQEVELQCRTELMGAEGEGAITVPFRKLSDICRALDEQAMMSVILKDQRFNISSGRSRFTLSTLPAEQYPKVEHKTDAVKLQLDKKAFRSLLERTAFAMAEQDVRYFLNGMLLEIKNNTLVAVAADGHRLAQNNLPLSEEVRPTRVIVPRKGVLEMLRLLDEQAENVELSLSSSHIRIQTSELCLISKLLEGRFPDYDRLIPKVGQNVVVGNRLQLKEAFLRAAALFSDKARGVRLRLSSTGLKILAHNTERDEVEEDLEIEYQGQDLEIGFNVRYLLDFLSIMPSDQISLILSEPSESALLKGLGDAMGVYVLMPMRI